METSERDKDWQAAFNSKKISCAVNERRNRQNGTDEEREKIDREKKHLNDKQKSELAQTGAHAFSCTGEITGLGSSVCCARKTSARMHEPRVLCMRWHAPISFWLLFVCSSFLRRSSTCSHTPYILDGLRCRWHRSVYTVKRSGKTSMRRRDNRL